MKRALLLAVVLLALGASVAAAKPFGPAEDEAYAQAESFWGTSPVLCTSITLEVVPPDSLDASDASGTVLGRATQPNTPSPCEMRLVEGLTGEVLCVVVTHEFGHLLGYGHSDNPTSPMYVGSAPRINIPGCTFDLTAFERSGLESLYREQQQRCMDLAREQASHKRLHRCWRVTRHMHYHLTHFVPYDT